MSLALDTGIRPTLYVTYDRPSEPQDEKEPCACFYLAGAFDPDEITGRVGVAPSETARVGDDIDSTGLKRQESLWALHSRLQPSASVDLHVTNVLDQLDTNRLAFEELSREVGGVIEIVGLPQDCAPAVSLEREILERMAQYSVRLDCRRR